MRRLGLLALLLTVFITVRYPPAPIPCPGSEPPALRKIITPTQTWYQATTVLIMGHACTSPERWFQEEWSDLPEAGGHFLRRLPEPGVPEAGLPWRP